jgi:hypothetical protein
MVHTDYIVKSTQKISHFVHRWVILVNFEVIVPHRTNVL